MSIKRARPMGMSGLIYNHITLRNVSSGMRVESRVLDQVAVMSAALQLVEAAEEAEEAGVVGRG